MIKTIQSKVFLYLLPLYYIYCMLIDVVFTRGGGLGVVINISIMVLLIYLSFYNSYNKKFVYIYLWLLFNLILIFCNSSNPIFSLKEFGKNLIGILCFPLSFYFISSNKEVIRFLKVLIAIMILYMLNLVLANTFGWGQAYGGVDKEYAVEAGASIVTGSMPIVVALMMAPLISPIIPRKKLFLIIWSAVVICVLLVFKRTNLASLLIGYLLLFALYRWYKQRNKIRTPKVNKKKRIKLIVGFVILLGVFIAIFGKVILAQFDLRSSKLEEGSIEKEGRVIEWYLVQNEILNSDKIATLLFGKEPYNTSNNYGFETSRNIHGDFSMILFSTGCVGFVLYWIMQLYIALLILQYNKKRYLRSNQDILLFVIYLSTSAIWFLFCFSATLRYILLSSVYYMIHGMILRYFWNKDRMQEKLIALKNVNDEGFNCSKP